MLKIDTVEDFKDLLKRGVFLVDGEGNVDLDNKWYGDANIAVVFEVQGYGPHPAAIVVEQGSHPDSALQAAYEVLEERMLEKYPERFEELEEEWGDEALEIFTETFDGLVSTFSPEDAADIVLSTDAKKFVDIEEAEEEEDDYYSEDDYQDDLRR